MTVTFIDAHDIQLALVAKGQAVKIDGKIGPATRSAIYAVVQASVGAAAHWGADRLLIAVQQIILLDGGVDPGPIDGVWGDRTRRAFDDWSRQREEASTSPLPAPALRAPRKIDVDVFFDRVRAEPFGGALRQSQVDGMTRLLDVHERYFPTLADDRLAYCLSTVYRETGARMQPIVELGGTAYFTRMYDIRGARPAKARELGNIYPGDGARFPGMGDVQSTGRNNAKKARIIIKTVLALDVDFEADPRKLLDPLYSAVIMYYGMIHGTFTGKKLSDYIDGDGIEDAGEFHASRRIVNGLDHAAEIAGNATHFLAAIRAGRAASLSEA
jgi:putative chitinase